MPISNDKRTLTGGRALYTGKNAYASQGFENDTRQSQLPAMLMCSLDTVSTNLSADTDNVMNWGTQNTNKYFNPVFARGFSRIPSTGIFVVQASATYRLSFAGAANIAANQTMQVIAWCQRGPDVIAYRARQQNTDGVSGGKLTVGLSNLFIDLQAGDQVYLTINPGTSATSPDSLLVTTSALGGVEYLFGATYLSLEQVDLQ